MIDASLAALHNNAAPPADAADTPDRLLVVDDTEANRYAMARILGAAGYDVIAADCGRQALAMAREQQPAVVVLDVLLPDIMGWEVCARLKRDPETAAIPVLQISANYTTDHDHAHGLNGGADSYLVQPIDPAVLLANVQALRRRKTMLAASGDAETRLRALLDSAPVILFAADHNGSYTLFTGNCLGELNLAPDAIIGRSLYTLHADDRRYIANATSALAGEAFVDALTLYGRYFEIRYSPLRDAQARPDGFVAVATDITDRKRDEHAREDLLAIVAHDLRTPLTGIQLNIEVLKRVQAGGARGLAAPDAVLKTMERSAKHAERLITDLLDRAKMEAGTFTIQRALHDLELMLREATEMMAPIARAKGVNVALDIAGSVSIDCDGARLSQAICNLLDNAIKFSPVGGVITLRATDDLAEHAIAVEDQGPGVAAADLPRLFGRFSQGTVNRRRGTGLGLWIASGIVRAHGGRIWAENRAGAGARFCIALPK